MNFASARKWCRWRRPVDRKTRRGSAAQISRCAGSVRALSSRAIRPGDTDEEAQTRLSHFNDGVDMECLEDIALGYTLNPNIKDVSAASVRRAVAKETRSSVSPGSIVGSYESIARRLSKAVIESELDGIILIVPDYIKDIDAIAKRSLVRMTEHGVLSRITMPASSPEVSAG